MLNKALFHIVLAISLATTAGCAQTPEPPAERVYPAPQNLVGSTDELQLVTELSIDLAKTYGGERILVVLEIDDTLLAAPGNTGIDPCGSGLPMQPVQDDAAEQVQRLQEEGLKVMVLTSRDASCRDQTLGSLAENGFNFSTSAWPPATGYAEAFKLKGGKKKVVYKDGVFFTSGQDKGIMLKALLEKSGAADPVLVIATDHQKQSLSAFMKAFSWTATKVHTWHYTREALSSDIAEL